MTNYGPVDAVLLAETDEASGELSGSATEWIPPHLFGDEHYVRLTEISNGRIYSLRTRRAYRQARSTLWAIGAVSPERRSKSPRPTPVCPDQP